MIPLVKLAPAALVGALSALATMSAARLAAPDEAKAFTPAGFSFEIEVAVPGSPEEVYDAFTGDISPWWDHTFSKKPKALYIEPRPGGSFMEIFDERGDGVQHARVTYAQRGKLLRMVGPLGLAGNGVDMEMTLAFSAVGENTQIAFKAFALGAVQPGFDAVVPQVWNHFLVERFKPYVESGAHRKR